MGQEPLEPTATDMQTGGQPDAADRGLMGRAEAMADRVRQRYGEARERAADLAETIGEDVADRSHRMRERLEDFEPREAGRAALRQAKNTRWPLLLIGGAVGFGIAAWMGASAPRGKPAKRARTRRNG